MFLGIDLGTSSLKALVLDVDGTIVGTASATYPIATPQPGWAESEPEAWWLAAARAVPEAAGAHASQIAAVGLSGQMHGVVLSDDAGRALRPAILWADSRTHRQLEAYGALSSELRRKLANPLATGMAGPTLLWLRDNERQHYREADWALQPKDWLRLRLIDEAATEPSDASGTLLYDLTTDYWAKDVLHELDLRLDLLAPIRESVEICGVLSRAAAAHLGLRPTPPLPPPHFVGVLPPPPHRRRGARRRPARSRTGATQHRHRGAGGRAT
jgi:xylulokinase